ncbi:MAG: hypothetical protein K6B41_04045 [Butyrivibrio sp.]|nr:hypothetical protein [Butyrivibrio sp.]
MLNEERVILMTKMAAFEKHEGKKNRDVNTYFRGDYVGYSVLKSVISATIAYLILVAAYVLYNFEGVLKNIYNTDLIATGKKFLIYYILLVGVYSLISYIVYSYKYSRMRNSMKTYYGQLKTLQKIYEKE